MNTVTLKSQKEQYIIKVFNDGFDVPILENEFDSYGEAHDWFRCNRRSFGQVNGKIYKQITIVTEELIVEPKR
jgi:hypothetical protein